MPHNVELDPNKLPQGTVECRGSAFECRGVPWNSVQRHAKPWEPLSAVQSPWIAMGKQWGAAQFSRKPRGTAETREVTAPAWAEAAEPSAGVQHGVRICGEHRCSRGEGSRRHHHHCHCYCYCYYHHCCYSSLLLLLLLLMSLSCSRGKNAFRRGRD